MSLEDAPGAARCRRCGSTLRTQGLAGICLRCLALDGIENEGPPPADNGKGSGFSPGRTIGDYELLEEVGHGGMGVVFKARQNRLERVVAIKVLRAGWLAKAGELARFRSEAKALAGLHHPNIVAVHEVGEHDGQPYFSMEFVAGRTLEEIARGHPLPPSRAAQYVRRIAEAIQYAHEQEVLHRDLKPSNVIIDSDDQPRVTDFGLAKRLEGDADLTMTGQVLGSPNFMPPEQASAGRGEVGPASDVYSLGALLYYLVTGRPPFLSETITDTLRQVAETEPASPRLLVPTVPKDLETICLKCLQKEPRHRYATAQAVADELGRFFRDEPIQARPSGAAEKLWRWCRRNRALAISGGVGAALVLTVAIGSPIAAIRINRERKHAEIAREHEAALRVRAEGAERDTQLQLYSALLKQAQATVRSGEIGQRVAALDALRRAAAISNSFEPRREVFAAMALPDLRFVRELPLNAGTTMAELDSNFERLAVAHGGADLEIRAVSDNHLIASLAASTNLPAYLGYWNPDGRYFALKRDQNAAGTLGIWEIWDLSDFHRALLLRDVPLGAICFHPRVPELLVAHAGTVTTWDLQSGAQSDPLQIAQARILLLRYSPDGTRFAKVCGEPPEQTLSINQVHDGKELASAKFTENVGDLNWHPDGRWIAAVDHGGTVRLLDSRTEEMRLLGHHKAQAVRTAFSPDGRYLLTGGWERELICWDMRRMEKAFVIGLDSFTPKFRADGRMCALGRGLDLHLSLYTFEFPNGFRDFPEDLGVMLRFAAFSPEGRWLAAVGQRHLGLWDLAHEGPGALGEKAGPSRLFFTRDSSELFVSFAEQDCARYRIGPATNSASSPVLQALPLQKPHGFSAITIASNLLVWTGAKGSHVCTFDDPRPDDEGWIPTSRGMNWISPNEQWLLICRSFSSLLNLYRLPHLEPVVTLTNRGGIGSFAFSPHGDELAVSSSQRVEFWNTRTWQRTRELTNFMGIIYSPDGRTMWLTRDYRDSGLYDASTLKLLLPLPTGAFPLALSPDGRSLAVSVNLRRLQVWDLKEVRRQLRDVGLDWEQP